MDQLAHAHGYHSLDSIAAIVVGLMVIYIAWEVCATLSVYQ
jgi:divalent metal cation (Fe/Co/Zn/Cd) transporter